MQKVLKPWHVVLFGLGLAADATGAFLMNLIATENRAAGIEQSALNQLMGVTGVIAIVLMAVHLAWAIVVLVRNREAEKTSFHRFSIIAWGIWLVPYIVGALGSSVG